MSGTYSTWAPVYRKLGLWPRRIKPGTKACFDAGWQQGDSELDPQLLQRWIDEGEQFGIGLLMGSPLPDGTRLGALDIDRDEYVRLGRELLRDPPCGRFGSKGVVYFVRVAGNVRNTEFKVRGDDGGRFGKVAECLFDRRLCVIPPTVHPDTGKPYGWVGTPLHETDFADLPLLEM